MVNKAETFLKSLVDIFRSEHLQEDAPPPPGKREGFFAWLFRAEELPKAAVSVQPPRPGMLSYLLRPDETLPEDEDTRPRRPSIFTVVFSREKINDLAGKMDDHQKEPPPGGKEYNRAEEE